MSSPGPASVDRPFYFRKYALRMLKLGWRVFPAKPGTKEPAIKNWSRYCRMAPSPEQVLRWGESRTPFGILLACGCGDDGISYGAIDLDEDDPERAARLLAVTKGIFGETPLVRIGRPNRRVLIYALSARAARSRNFGKVDVLSAGRCVVTHGIHPVTGRPYTWEGLGPQDVPAWDLP